ncbi:bacteriophage holin [Methanocella sp. MCL-LM]|uniref:bacteriophage holin n=1 Tax=Methanocella sp. MCL-LM TaxID=3412035 RepID=UPI003C711CD8
MVDKLKPTAFGLAAGILWGLAVLVTGLTAALFGYGVKFVDVVGSFYLGYQPDLTGSIIGGVWGFIDGLIGGFVFALLYNYLARMLEK